MKNRKIRLISALCAAVILVALVCIRVFSPSQATQINFPTAATTGTLYPLGAAFATLWNEKVPGVQVTVQASGGGVDNLNFLREGEAQVSMAVTSVAWQSQHGTDTFEGKPDAKLRILAGLYYNPNQVVATKDSGIEQLSDIAGKRFAPGAPGSTTVGETQAHLTRAGVAYPDGFSAQYVGFNEAIDLMRNRQLDGAWIMAGVPTAAVSEICSTAGGHLVPIDDDVIAALQADYPWYEPFVIPAGTYAGQETDVQTTAIRMVLMASSDLSDEVAYQLVKTLWENMDGLSESFAALKGLSVENAASGVAEIPLHDGAAKYYREIGVL